MRRTLLAATTLVLLCSTGVMSQSAVSHIAIMPMANMSKPADLDFQGGACDIDRAGTTMTCAFQQVFLTPVPEDPTTCRVVTNRYAQIFRKEDDRRWVSSDGPDGPCGITTVTTLERDDKSLPAFWRVTMTTRKVVAKADASGQCAGLDEAPETLASTTVRRPLGCSFVVAGSLEF